jgi:hypothetical protein
MLNSVKLLKRATAFRRTIDEIAQIRVNYFRSPSPPVKRARDKKCRRCRQMHRITASP